MNPSSLLALEKDRINRTHFSRPHSLSTTRNPILEGDPCTPVRPPKITVPDYLTEQKKLTERPKGLGKSVFSFQLQSSLSGSLGLFDNYRPTRKHPPKPASGIQAPYVPVKKILRPQTPSRDPILQLEWQESPGTGKRYGYAVKHNRVNFQNESPDVSLYKQENYNRRNGSSRFSQGENQRSSSRKRYLPEKPVCTGDILSYSFALSYRDEKITDKIN